MCTALTYRGAGHYFGRNLDLDHSYHETVTIAPRRFPLPFPGAGTLAAHYAMIGMAFVQQGYPLYYDAVNECGLAIAGLNFPGNAYYGREEAGKDNIPAYALIPWLLAQCRDVPQARERLARLQLVDTPFSPQLPPAPLHWLLADQREAVVIESCRDGLHVYDDPAGVLTNNPPFPFQQAHLTHFMQLTREAPRNSFGPGLALAPDSQGMGAMGLPGDWSSPSRFVRAAFVRLNAPRLAGEGESVHHFFHMLDAVAVPRGCVAAGSHGDEITIYSACCNQDTGVYYYATYDDRRIHAVELRGSDLEGSALTAYPLAQGPEFG